MARVLVLEDETLIAMLVQDWLSELGHEIVGPASCNADALALLKNNQDIDIALLDVSVNGEISTPVAAAIDALNVPFAFTTGHGASGVPALFAHRPIVTKPFEFDDFGRVISNLLLERAKSRL